MTSPTTPTAETHPHSQDSWGNRIKNASVFLGLSTEEVEEKLKELGVEEHPAGLEMLSDEEVTPFGDLRKVFGDDLGIPLAKLRMAMKHLRGPKDSKKTDELDVELVRLHTKYGVKPKLSNIPSEQLLEDYQPDRPEHPITLALKKRFGDRRVIVFKPDTREVDIEATANYITDLDQGYAEEDFAESEGEMVRVYKVGEVPDEVVSEDPLFPGIPLRRNRSTANRIDWGPFELEIRQFVRLALEAGEVDPDSRPEMRTLIADAREGLDNLKKLYPEVAVTYREAKKVGKLPSLVMTMKQATAVQKQDPFSVGKKNRQY